MTVTAHIDRKDLLYVDEMIGRAQRKSVAFANQTIEHLAVVFGRSARKATPPGNRGGNISKMNKKYRVRRVKAMTLSMQRDQGLYWYQDRQSKKIFWTKKPMSKASRFKSTVQGDDTGPLSENDNARVIPIRRGIEAWSKKRKRFIYYGTTLRKGLHEGVKYDKTRAKIGTRIPYHGAAKGGWNRLLRNMGIRNSTDIAGMSKRIGVTRRFKGKNPTITHTNNVKYVSKIAPTVVQTSMNKAVAYFKWREKKRFNRLVKNEFKYFAKSSAKMARMV